MKLKATIIFVLLAAAAMIGFYSYDQSKQKTRQAKKQQEQEQQEKAKQEARKLNSDTHRIKGTITVGLDSYLGYYPLRSNRLSNKMLTAGYQMEYLDDCLLYTSDAADD